MESNRNAAEPLVEVRLLGKFGVSVDGVAIDDKRWARNSAKSLVKLLAIKPFHALHREQIMDALWLEQTPETALNNLNKAIHGARRAFEPDLEKGNASLYLQTQNNQVNLRSPGSLHIDLDEFERLANLTIKNDDLEAGEKALDLYRGELLVEDIYEDWIYSRRESVRLLFRKAATKTAELIAADGDLTASVEIMKRLVSDDSSDEYAHRFLMRLYGETGSKYQALKQFELCQSALRALGIDPEPETIELGQKIKRGEILPVRSKPAHKAKVAGAAPRITPLTFHLGRIGSARFLPDGESIVISAAWNDSAPELFRQNAATGESESLGVTDADVLSVSAFGELALMINPKPFGFDKFGTLAVLPVDGGNPVELLDDIQSADWHPMITPDEWPNTAERLAIVRGRSGKCCLEFPPGNAIYQTDGWIGHPRFSPDGKSIAFIEHPFIGDDRGRVVQLSNLQSGAVRDMTRLFTSVQGLSWFGAEIRFTAAERGIGRSVRAVNSNRDQRTIYNPTGNLTLHDVAEDGRLLVTDDKFRVQVSARADGDDNERDLSWHDWTLPRFLSDDGATLLFEEGGASGGSRYSAYVRKLDGSGTKKLGDGSAIALSPDNRFALLRFRDPYDHLAMVPVEGGDPVEIENDKANPLHYDVFATFFPDGDRLIFSADGADGTGRIYIQDLAGGPPVRFAAEDEDTRMLSGNVISPDGRYAALTDASNSLALYDTADGRYSPLSGLTGYWLIRWAGDGKSIFVWRREGIPAIVYRYDIVGGTLHEWLRLLPKDPTGVHQVVAIKLTPDGKTYAFSYLREQSDLYLIEDPV